MAVALSGTRSNTTFKAVFDGLFLSLSGLLSLTFLQASIESTDEYKFARTEYVPEASMDLYLKFAYVAI